MNNPKFVVTVEYYVRRVKELTIFAHNVFEAEEKACQRIMEYSDVANATALDCRKVWP